MSRNIADAAAPRSAETRSHPWQPDRALEVNPLTSCAELWDVMTVQPWMELAACPAELDPDAWFPEPGAHGPTTRRAIAICQGRCPVRRECLDYARSYQGRTRLTGIWGGLTDRERSGKPDRRKHA